MKIRIRAILVIVLTNFTIITLSILAGTGYVKEHIEKYIEADMLVVADIADRFISSELDLLKHKAGEAAGSLAAAAPADWAAILEERARRYPEFVGLSALGRDAEIAARAGERPAPPEALGNEYVQRAFRGQTAFTSTVPAAGGPLFYLAVPIPETNERILLLTLDGLYFSNLASEYKIWETGHIFIDDRDGHVIANIRPEWVRDRRNFLALAQTDQQYEGVAAVVRKAVAGERGIGYYSMNGVARICAYRPISSSEEGWSLGIVAPLSESPVGDVNRGLVLIAAVCFLLNIVAAVVASNFIKRPFERVAALKERAEAGLRAQKKMTAGIARRDYLLQTVNRTIDLLLRSEPEDFSKTLLDCMGLMARAVEADRIYLHKNHTGDGRLYSVRLYEWSEEAQIFQDARTAARFSCDARSALIKDRLGRGESIHSLVRDLPPPCVDCLGVRNALSVMIIPIILGNEFWGFVGFDNCRGERLFGATEEFTMRSGSLLVASAMLRNEYMLDLREASARLEAALTEAEKANSAKSSFLAHMSHEIRTPLNAVVGLSELTLGERDLSWTVESNLEKIYGAGTTILSIINDILDITKIESGKLELYPVRYDAPSLINDVVALNVVRIGERPITFRLSVDENLPGLLYGDDLRVKQVFNNLLSNAFKYTNAGTVEWRVSFELEGDGVWLVSSVRDTGIGIRPEDARELFSDFKQVDAETNRNVQGTGLGLAITKRLVEMMDGKIELESEYGRGSTFRVRLRQALVSDAPIGAEVAESLMGLRYTLSRRGRHTKLARPDLSYARVLVVDDIATNLDVVKGMLKPYGLKVDCADSGARAVEIIRAGNPRYGAVFMDHMMPGMDGIEATRIIRREIGTDYARNIPIIALTANAIAGNEEMFLNEGFQAFISKPIDMEKLDAALRRWVRDKSLEPESPAEVSAAGGREAGNTAGPLNGLSIDGLDTRRLLERFGGDGAALTDVLRSYSTNTRPLLDNLRRYLAEGNLADYAIVAHGIKGSSRGLFAEGPGQAAKALEMAAKAGDLGAVRAGQAALEKAVETLLENIDRALGGLDAASNRPAAARPDPALLEELREACRAFGMDRVDRVMAELESFQYESGGKLVKWLRAQVDNMAFEEISDGDWPAPVSEE